MDKKIFKILQSFFVCYKDLLTNLTVQHLSMPPLNGWETYDLANEILVTLSNIKGTDKPAQICRLAKAFAACLHI